MTRRIVAVNTTVYHVIDTEAGTVVTTMDDEEALDQVGIAEDDPKRGHLLDLLCENELLEVP